LNWLNVKLANPPRSDKPQLISTEAGAAKPRFNQSQLLLKMVKNNIDIFSLESIYAAKARLREILEPTPLMRNDGLSEQYGCEILLKREDLQRVRSYKIRGAYNKMASMSPEELKKGVICASAGNHAQGVALACQLLKVQGYIYMPTTTPAQKIKKVKFFGKSFVEVVLVGDTFDDSFEAAHDRSKKNSLIFVHPFEDPLVIQGQGTVGAEIIEQTPGHVDYVFLGVGGGGLAAGLGSFLKQVSPKTKLIGVEPLGAAAMKAALDSNQVVKLDQIDAFVDGAAVKKVGEINFRICKNVLSDIALVPEGKICQTILKLYNEEAIVAEPAGALSISVLDQYKSEIKGKRVVCVVSGGNNDITRTEEIKERALLYGGLKHYFIIKFPQRAGALLDFLTNVLGPDDDIAHFEYTKKHNREAGPALVGLELKRQEDYQPLIAKLKKHSVDFREVNQDELLFGLLV